MPPPSRFGVLCTVYCVWTARPVIEGLKMGLNPLKRQLLGRFRIR